MPLSQRKSPKWTRRQALTFGLGGVATVAAVGFSGLELVDRNVLPGKGILERVEGACSVSAPSSVFSRLGPSSSGTFYSAARKRPVGYTVAYPPGHRIGDRLPLVVALHGYGGNHRNALQTLTPAEALALRVDGVPLPPMGLVTVDGGGGYWNPHPGDDPMGMVIEELIPRCQRLGLGRPPSRIGTLGISMGGYGAILLAEVYPHLISAVAAISPAIWTTYDQARSVNAGAYASRASFARYDAVTHAGTLAHTAVRVASGIDDPFHPGVLALARSLPGSADVRFPAGCHTGPFFSAQQPSSLAFLGDHLG